MNPASVILIGASRDKQKLGYGVAGNLVANGYDGYH
jgi:acyl-CoA synthetase (NDP forming)